MKDSLGNDLIEIQTDFGDHLDILIILRGHPYSLGGSYVHGLANWEKLEKEAKQFLEILIKEKTVTEEEWLRDNKRVGGSVYVPSKATNKFKLHDRTGSRFGWFTRIKESEQILLI